MESHKTNLYHKVFEHKGVVSRVYHNDISLKVPLQYIFQYEDLDDMFSYNYENSQKVGSSMNYHKNEVQDSSH
jgi:hypothetical protein